MKTTELLSIAVIFIMMLPSHSTDARKRKELTDRQNWCEMAYRMARPGENGNFVLKHSVGHIPGG
ncbi:MAG: hypothetical protein J5976_00465 [Bacteroidales bacterium]|nr:hypothetical protein [Bacteroidales bacterium]